MWISEFQVSAPAAFCHVGVNVDQASPVTSHWHDPLIFPITPKSGPLRPMVTLVDANRALVHDLPNGFLKHRPHWACAARILLWAAETGAVADNTAAYEAMVHAIAHEGWFSRPGQAAAEPQAIMTDLLHKSLSG